MLESIVALHHCMDCGLVVEKLSRLSIVRVNSHVILLLVNYYYIYYCSLFWCCLAGSHESDDDSSKSSSSSPGLGLLACEL